jgi:hypothetical protein
MTALFGEESCDALAGLRDVQKTLSWLVAAHCPGLVTPLTSLRLGGSGEFRR